MPNQSNFTGNPFVKLWRSCISSIIAVASSHYTCHDSIGLTHMWDVGPQSPKPLPKQQKEMSSYMSLHVYLAFVKSVNVKKTNGERVNPHGNRDQLCSSLSNSVKKIGKSVSETHTQNQWVRPTLTAILSVTVKPRQTNDDWRTTPESRSQKSSHLSHNCAHPPRYHLYIETSKPASLQFQTRKIRAYS